MKLPPPPYSDLDDSRHASASSDPSPPFPSSGSSPGALPPFASRRTTVTVPSIAWMPFKVGRLDAPLEKPWVTVEAAKCHLVFLEAFHRLKLRVEQHRRGATAALSPEDRWFVFLHVATERFTKWQERWGCKDGAEDTIPLDCLLVWHTLNLNPRWYREDMARLHPDPTSQLADPDASLQLSMVELQLRNIEPRLKFDYELPEAEGAAGEWAKHIGTPHDALENLSLVTTRTLECPKCLNKLAVPWVAEKDSGYGQKGFHILCPRCELHISREALGVRRFLDDLWAGRFQVWCRQSELTLANAKAGAKCACTWEANLGNWGGRDGHSDFEREVREARVMRIAPEDVGSGVDWKLNSLQWWFMKNFGWKSRDARPLQEVMSAYTTAEPYSIDVPQAILRQGVFVAKAHALGWTDTDFIGSSDALLHRAQVRYHAFLDLAYLQRPKECLVPTLDIDLMWHTHVLDHEAYYNNTREGLGYFLNHNDGIEEGVLSEGFYNTASLWEARFGVPYSTCPCPRPAASLSTVLSALSQKLSLSSSSSAPSINKKALKSLGSIYTEANEMSHPSEHPAVLVDRLAQLQRKFEYERRMEKKGKGKEKEDGKGVEHLPAFILDEHTASCAQLRSAFEASQAGANITGIIMDYSGGDDGV